MENKLPKDQIINSSRDIGSLISHPEGITGVYPLKLFWTSNSCHDKTPVRVAFLVSKRNFKKAVTRNLIKRRMRSAYRNNKAELINTCISNNIHMDILFLYRAKEVVSHDDLLDALKKLLHILEVHISGKEHDT